MEPISVFLDHLAHERRLSKYTLRNYSHAVENFSYGCVKISAQKKILLVRFLLQELQAHKYSRKSIRDYVIEQQRRLARRTSHNHVSGLRTFFKFCLKQNG